MNCLRTNKKILNKFLSLIAYNTYIPIVLAFFNPTFKLFNLIFKPFNLVFKLLIQLLNFRLA